MKYLKLISCLLIVVVFYGCGKQNKPDTLVTSGYDETEMDSAILKAQKSVDDFIKIFKSKTGKNHSVKVPVTDDNGTEHFWVSNLTYSNNEFSGTIANEPGVVKNVKYGDKIKVAKNKISDWMYIKNDKIYGNYTMRPLLKNMPEDEAKLYRSLLAEP